MITSYCIIALIYNLNLLITPTDVEEQVVNMQINLNKFVKTKEL